MKNKAISSMLALSIIGAFAAGFLAKKYDIFSREDHYNRSQQLATPILEASARFKDQIKKFQAQNGLSDEEMQKVLVSHVKSGFVEDWFKKPGPIFSESGTYQATKYGGRNVVQIPDGQAGFGKRADFSKEVDFGPRSDRVLVVIGKNGIWGSVILPSAPELDGTDFLLFERDKVYQFSWNSIHGRYHVRR